MNLPQKTPYPAQPVENTADRPRVDSEQVFRGAPAVEIEHAGQRYLLRVTRDPDQIVSLRCKSLVSRSQQAKSQRAKGFFPKHRRRNLKKSS